jgi:hypothetical protein
VPTRITKPVRPGTIIRFEGEPTPVIPPSAAETVAVPIVHDWGPVNVAKRVNSFPEFETEFGSSATAGRIAVLGAFAGQALPGQGGAGSAWVYRMSNGAVAAKGTLGTLTLLALHAGTLGNGLRAILENDPSGDALKQQFRLLLNNAQVERYTFTKANPQELADAINARSNYVHAGLGAVQDSEAGVTAIARQVSGRTVAVDVVGASAPMVINWGDASLDTSQAAANETVEHTYAADGLYTITLTPPTGVALTLAITLPWPAPTALANAEVTLTGGTEGSALTVTEWMGALTAFEYLPFSVIVPYDLTDPAIRATVVSWVKGQDTANRPVMLVLGGASNETVDQAISDAALSNDPHVVRLAGGSFRDDVLNASLSTSQLAPRIAGMLAALGDANSLTFKPLGGLSYVGQGFANDEIEAAILGGVTAIAVSTNPATPLRIERGLTTFTTINDPTRPYDFFSDPRLVRLVDLFIRRMKEWGDNEMIGNVPVNDDSRSALRARAGAEISDLENRGLIIPGTDYLDVPVPTDPQYLDCLIYEFGFQCARTALYIFGFGVVR